MQAGPAKIVTIDVGQDRAQRSVGELLRALQRREQMALRECKRRSRAWMPPTSTCKSLAHGMQGAAGWSVAARSIPS